MDRFARMIQEAPGVVRFLGAILLAQLIVWTLVPDLLYSILPLDALEALAWGSGFSLGNAKHPPLTGWIAGVTAVLTGHADWPIYLLSQLCTVGGAVCIYLLAREFAGRTESALAALTPQFILYYTVTSPEFNVNMPLLLLWPLAALFFVRACKRDCFRDWILLGVTCGLCFLCKYYSALLYSAFAVYLLIAPERRRLLLHAGPWMAAGAFAVVILPHAMWAVSGGLAMMEAYVEKRMAFAPDATWFHRHIQGVLIVLGTASLVYLIPFLAFLLAKRARPRIPSESDRREAALFAAIMTGVPLVIVCCIGLSGKAMRTMWLTPLFFPAGILLNALFPREWTARQLKWFCAETALFFLVSVTGVAVAGMVHPTHRKHFPAKEFTAQIESFYREQTGEPLRIVFGDAWAAGMFRHYLPGHPQGCIRRNASEVQRLGPMLREFGGVAVSDDPDDIDAALETSGNPPDTPRTTFEIESRALFGKPRVRKMIVAILTPEAKQGTDAVQR